MCLRCLQKLCRPNDVLHHRTQSAVGFARGNLRCCLLQVMATGRGSITTFIQLLSTGSRSVSAVPAVSGTTPFLIAPPSSDREWPPSSTSSRHLQQLPATRSYVVLPWERWGSHFGDVLSSQVETTAPQPRDIHGKSRPSHLRDRSVQRFSHVNMGRALAQQAQQLVNFDVDGDGAFSASDYVVLMQLGLRWTNSYSKDAQPWIQTFQNVTYRSEITSWMMQSTDPDFLYAALSACTSPRCECRSRLQA